MYSLSIQIVDHVIQVCTPYPLSTNRYTEFITDAAADMRIAITKEELLVDHFRVLSQNPKKKSDIDPSLSVPNLLSRVADGLSEYDTILFHGAAICVNNHTYIFTAPSGTGKTTHILKWLKNCPEAFVINGDKPFITTNDDSLPHRVYGSPWAGKENLFTNCSSSLDAIIIMERSDINHIRQIKFGEAFPTLLQQTYRPNDTVKMRKVLESIKRLSKNVKFYHFCFNNYKDDCFEIAYNSLVKQI